MSDYIKTWNRLNATNYELYCMKYHRENYNQETYHWQNIPETILFDSGFIHDFNNLRLKRKRVYEEEGKYFNPIREYGLDGLSIEIGENEIITYNGIQSKLWSNTLKGNDLGTFYQSIFMRMRKKTPGSKGYLYHTCKLQVDVRDDILNSRGDIVNNKLVYNEQVQQQFLNEINVINGELNESNFKLRNYQIEAIEALNQDWSGIKLLNLPCGTGKTIIYANHVRDKAYKNIFIISPLKVHVKQNLDKIKIFLQNHETLLLDSDQDGSTLFEDLENILDKKSLISTTFESAENLFKKLFLNNEESEDESDEELLYESNYDLTNSILIVDEAHNLLNRDELIKVVKSFPKVLLVTATPPSSMEEILDCDVVYKYPFRKAIEDGYICDYQIYLPLLEANESNILIEKPIELNDLDDVMTKKCLYLITGMLQTGSRKCIVYLSSQEDCRQFINIFNEVNNKYHFLPIWTNMIISDTTQTERINILTDFQRESYELKILCSVHILDEGVDIPNCDSVFITNVYDQISSIKTVQRICRANRKVNNNPNKKASCFLWTDDLNKIVGCLSLLKENDIEFHKKIRMINNDYEKNDSIERKELVIKECGRVNNFIQIKCMNMEEMWEMKRQALFRFCDENNRIPKKKECYENVRIGKWLQSQKKKIIDIINVVYIKLSENQYIKNELDRYIEEKELRSHEHKYTIQQKKDLLLKYVNEKNKLPSCNEEYDNIKLGKFYSHLKEKIMSIQTPIYMEYQNIQIIKKDFDRYLKKKYERSQYIKYTIEEKKYFLTKYVNEKNKLPKLKEKYENFDLGIFYMCIKQKIENKLSPLYLEYQNIQLIKTDFDRYLKDKTENSHKIQYSIIEKKDMLIKFVCENNKVPMIKEEYKNCKIGSFYKSIIRKVKNNQSPVYKEYQNIQLIKNDFDRYLNKKTVRSLTVQYTVQEKKNLLIKYVNENNIIPTKRQVHENYKLGYFYSDLKKKVKNNQSPVYKEYQNIQLIKNDFDKFINKKLIKTN